MILPQKLDDVDEFNKLFLIEMSYSRISTYDMCPAKYFYSYIMEEPREFAAAATLGNVVHEVLENHVGAPLSLAEMLESYRLARSKYDPLKQIPTDLIDVGTELLQEFVDRHEDESIPVVAKEMPFDFVLGTAYLRGYIDRVDRLSQDVIEVVDYKTGKWQEAKKHIHRNIQLSIYFLALTLLFPEVNEFRTGLYYLRTGKTIGHTFYRDDIPEVSARVNETITKIIDDPYYKYTDNFRFCSFCDHAKSGTCPRGVAQNKTQRRR